MNIFVEMKYAASLLISNTFIYVKIHKSYLKGIYSNRIVNARNYRLYNR